MVEAQVHAESEAERQAREAHERQVRITANLQELRRLQDDRMPMTDPDESVRTDARIDEIYAALVADGLDFDDINAVLSFE